MGIDNFAAGAAAQLSRVPISWVKHEAKTRVTLVMRS